MTSSEVLSVLTSLEKAHFDVVSLEYRNVMMGVKSNKSIEIMSITYGENIYLLKTP